MKTDPVLKTLAVLAIVFGLLTIFSGGRALFGDAQARAAVGNAVGFVLWFNFLAGFLYVVVGAAAWLGLRWVTRAATFLALTTAIVAGVFGFHVLAGGAFEIRTVWALAFRFLFWTALALMARRRLAAIRR
jgi:hypothetical protein